MPKKVKSLEEMHKDFSFSTDTDLSNTDSKDDAKFEYKKNTLVHTY